jgi:CBS domain-containing protein
MQVKDAMTTNVVGIQCDATIDQAIEIMLKSRISALPVFDDKNTLVGVLSEGDLLRRAELGTEKQRPRWLELLLGPGRFAGAYAHAHGRKVSEVMTPDVVTIDQTASLEEAVDLMNRHNVKRLPVLSEGRLVGIIARADLLRALAPLLRAPAKAGSDEETHDFILAELGHEVWAPLASIDVDVRNGVVSLRGSLSDERQRDAIKVIAENAPGVTAVHDHMIWVEGNSGAYLLSEEDAKAARASAT